MGLGEACPLQDSLTGEGTGSSQKVQILARPFPGERRWATCHLCASISFCVKQRSHNRVHILSKESTRNCAAYIRCSENSRAAYW